MFKIGDKAVYPAHGVVIIESIESREISGNRNEFFIMRSCNSDMTIMIPTRNAETVGLRQVIASTLVPEVFEVLRSPRRRVDTQTWNRRYREYWEKIKTGSIFEVAEVLRDLYRLKGDKELSFGERKMLDTAQGLLVSEIAVANDMEEARVEQDIRRIFFD